MNNTNSINNSEENEVNEVNASYEEMYDNYKKKLKSLELVPVKIPSDNELSDINKYNINNKMILYQLPDQYIIKYAFSIDFKTLSMFQKISDNIADKYYFLINWELVEKYSNDGINLTSKNIINKYKTFN
jgi:hypothetical protein